MSKHNKRDVAIPTREATHLVLIKTQIFARFKIVFNAPSRPKHLHHHL